MRKAVNLQNLRWAHINRNSFIVSHKSIKHLTKELAHARKLLRGSFHHRNWKEKLSINTSFRKGKNIEMSISFSSFIPNNASKTVDWWNLMRFTADFYRLLLEVLSHFWFIYTSEEITIYNHAYSEFHHCHRFYCSACVEEWELM